MVVPVVVGALGAIADRLSDGLAQIPGTINRVERHQSSGVFLNSQGSGRASSLRMTPPMVG